MIEGEDVDVVALVLLDDVGGIGVSVERVHEHKWHIDVVLAVEVLNLADGQVEERHAVSDLNDRLGANATHRGTQTTVQLNHSQLIEVFDSLGVSEVIVVDHLLGLRGSNAVPVNGSALGLVIEVSAEQSEEVVHFSLETLVMVRKLHTATRASIGGALGYSPSSPPGS